MRSSVVIDALAKKKGSANVSISSAKSLMTDTGSRGSNTIKGETVLKTDKPVYQVGKPSSSSGSSSKPLNLFSGKGLEAVTNWLSTPKEPDSYKAHGGLGPNGQPGSTNNSLLDGLNDVLDTYNNPSTSAKSSGSGRGGSGGVGSGSYSPTDVMDLINNTAMSNNEWSAYQAQLDREWQEYMSSSAHQREVADLKAAGLNPVLSAGGSGASTPSGAMGQTDTSNTRLIAEVAMMAMEATSNAAGSIGRVASKKESGSLLNKFLSSNFAKTAGRAATYAITRKLVNKLF